MCAIIIICLWHHNTCLPELLLETHESTLQGLLSGSVSINRSCNPTPLAGQSLIRQHMRYTVQTQHPADCLALHRPRPSQGFLFPGIHHGEEKGIYQQLRPWINIIQLPGVGVGQDLRAFWGRESTRCYAFSFKAMNLCKPCLSRRPGGGDGILETG